MHSLLLALLFAYGALVLVGGVIGYLKAKSRASLIAGIVCSSVLDVAASLVATGSVRWGAALGVVTALALIGRFLPAFLRTKRLLPAGLVLAVGALVIGVGTVALVQGN